MDSGAPANLPTLRQMLANAHLRLIVLALLLSGVTLMVSGLFTIKSYYQRSLELTAGTIGYAVEPAIVFGDTEAIEEGLHAAGMPDVRLVELRDPMGTVVARWPRSAGRDVAARTTVERVLGLKPVTRVVRQGGVTIGELRVFGQVSTLRDYLLSGALISLCCLAISGIALRILAKRMQTHVVEPLELIASVAHAVRRDRAFDRRVPSTNIAEIDRFGRDFNALLEELEGWHQSMTAEQSRLAHNATHDPLTGLGNRALFDHRLESLLAQADRAGTSFAMLYIDADRFKQVNDLHGHASGDALLIAIAERLRDCTRQNDIAFRLGGDEFAILLGPAIDAAGLALVIARIEECMDEPVLLLRDRSIVPSLSVGAAIYPRDGASIAALVSHADAQMYEHKARKRDSQFQEEANA